MPRSRRRDPARSTLVLVATLALWALSGRGPALAEDEAVNVLARWWNGDGATAPAEGPFGFLRQHGVAFGGTYYGALFGIQEAEGGAAAPYDQGAELNLDAMPARLLDVPALDGLVVTVEGRWRAERPSDDPDTYVQASSGFEPSNWSSGVGWRFLQGDVSYARRLDAHPETEVWLKAGWVQPRYEFVLQRSYDNANGATTAGGSANFGLQAGAYVQADQLVCREAGASSNEGSVRPQGLVAFGLAMWAPARNSDLQLYLHAGLDWTGAIPTRDLDSIVVAVAYGNYSRSTHTETIAVEGGYHVALNRWLELYPYVQSTIRPAGTGEVANAVIVGVGTSVTF